MDGRCGRRGGIAPIGDPDSLNDRRVLTSYDRNNRKVSETRVAVEVSTSSAGISTHADLTTTFGYDAVGNLTRTTDALGHPLTVISMRWDE